MFNASQIVVLIFITINNSTAKRKRNHILVFSGFNIAIWAQNSGLHSWFGLSSPIIYICIKKGEFVTYETSGDECFENSSPDAICVVGNNVKAILFII